MSNRYKNILYTVLVLLAMYLVYEYRQTDESAHMVYFSGKTMGPITYNVKYFDAEERDFQKEVDSVLMVFNQSLNTYIPSSEITQYNTDTSFQFELPYFREAVLVSKELYELTEGAFDPSIGPLINTWGFGHQKAIVMDSTVIDSLRQFTGFDKVQFDEKHITKTDKRVQLDFSASAKGYGVDVVTELLQSKGITNAFVEIGGEVRASGINLQSGEKWKVGILDPNSEELDQRFVSIISLSDKGMATSGNYFNYHIVDGVKYGHTISPMTGYPIQHSLLSASVITDNCHTSDALATAFMVFGLEKTKAFLEQHTEYDAYLIYSDETGKLNTFATPGIASFINPVQ
ncbi:FAD:protein FMN transferase [Fulvivirga sp. M361]|uniref:FAD:protein FMN transferase n=1 Tax=Fulvivirga sp. M361 TaxID=2594266 RepID=UPI00117AD7EA|nr:FAD:protein FMN transferase [Fulvivirga sp. M361]TRX50893.1 FAD:protein FMN transferase [Fulvivirga sp. M361]